MKILGVTGGTGTGKSTVAKILGANGAKIIDADRIAHMLQKKGPAAFDEIIEYFGEGILDTDGEINRRILGALVFNDQNALAALNEIVHRHVALEMKRLVKKYREEGVSLAVLDVPIPIENGFFDTAECVWAVVANDDLRIERIMQRSGLSEKEAASRIGSQLSNREYSELADVTIDNEGTFEELEKLVLYELRRFKDGY
ncbi:MAG: dephospho-CoA kinase [Clostridia bacterium]|nr:dephospho-CoA kinase [Clostridia bacterium]